VLTGTAGDDVIAAGAGDDQVMALAGNDIVRGEAGDDEIDGGAGNDQLSGGEGDDSLLGGAGDDVLAGGADDDTLDGGDGSDTVDYSGDTAGVTVDLAAGEAFGDDSGADELSGIENVIGGAGNDTLLGDAGANALSGGAGNDTLEGGAGDDTIDGGEGSDTLVLAGAIGTVLLDLGAHTASGQGIGSDSFHAIERVLFGDGDDTIRLAGASVVASAIASAPIAIDGGAGHDVLELAGTGESSLGPITGIEELKLVSGAWLVSQEGVAIDFQDGAQTLHIDLDLLGDNQFAGTISGFGQEDLIQLQGIGDANAATLGAGNLLTVLGGATGPITLQLDPAEDFAGMAFSVTSDGNGGVNLSYAPAATDDVLTGGNGDDTLDGAAGNDTITGGAGNDTLSGGTGTDSVDGGSGNDLVSGGAGDDQLKGGSGVDQIDGGDGNDVIDAGSDNDTVLGGAGNDQLKGGSDDDRLNGGAGDDMLSGGSGHDTFVFQAGMGRDVIADFTVTGSSSDVIEFSLELFADFAAVMGSAEQNGRDLVITVDEQSSITLANVTLSSLQTDDFRFV